MLNRQTTNECDAILILLSESQAAFNYWDRLLFTATEMAKLSEQVEFKSYLQQSLIQLTTFWETEILRVPFDKNNHSHNVQKLLSFLKAGHHLLTSMQTMGAEREQLLELGCKYLNLLYSHAHRLHNYLKRASHQDVTFPNVGALYVVEDGIVPCFATSPEHLKSCAGPGEHLVVSLEKQRDKKFQDYLGLGHKSILHKNYPLALQYFKKALHLKVTAEALTLTGWAHALLNQMEHAKNHCLKAISLNPDYGPPYNDLGTYLLKEGLVEESLKWFSLAKRAPVYDNREFPYLNTGRVYLTQGRHEMALAEFTKAQMLAPFNLEITQTVEKIRALLEKEATQKTSDVLPMPPKPPSPETPGPELWR